MSSCRQHGSDGLLLTVFHDKIMRVVSIGTGGSKKTACGAIPYCHPHRLLKTLKSVPSFTYKAKRGVGSVVSSTLLC
jgi:hypothetical protein